MALSPKTITRPEFQIANGVDRRAFIKQQLRIMAWLALGTAGISRPRLLQAASDPDLAVAEGNASAATRAAVDALGGMARFVKPGAKVVIKPNMSFPHGPERATNTHPEVVFELVVMCKESGAARVKVLDHPLRSSELCIEGVKQACSIFEEDLVHGITKSRFFKPTEIPNGVDFTQTDVLQDVLEADVLIAAPVAKSHSSAGVSLCMKGMMGLVYNRWIMHSRYDLHTAIVDLASLLKPQLCVVDATRVLTTNGPSGPGNVLQGRRVIASLDMVAADAMTVQMFKWYGQALKPRNVKHIRIAHQRGLGRMDVDNLNTKYVKA